MITDFLNIIKRNPCLKSRKVNQTKSMDDPLTRFLIQHDHHRNAQFYKSLEPCSQM
jgi:hypothetical protein